MSYRQSEVPVDGLSRSSFDAPENTTPDPQGPTGKMTPTVGRGQHSPPSPGCRRTGVVLPLSHAWWKTLSVDGAPPCSSTVKCTNSGFLSGVGTSERERSSQYPLRGNADVCWAHPSVGGSRPVNKQGRLLVLVPGSVRGSPVACGRRPTDGACILPVSPLVRDQEYADGRPPPLQC